VRSHSLCSVLFGLNRGGFFFLSSGAPRHEFYATWPQRNAGRQSRVRDFKFADTSRRHDAAREGCAFPTSAVPLPSCLSLKAPHEGPSKSMQQITVGADLLNRDSASHVDRGHQDRSEHAAARLLMSISSNHIGAFCLYLVLYGL
jgi:hypothetical protein